MEDGFFPSGSNWGLTQLQRLRFLSQPELEPLESLQWKHTLSQESAGVLDNLKQSFALDEKDWKDQVVRGPYEDFYSLLSEMVPRPQAKLTPRNPALRSNTHLPSSSTQQASSPWSTLSTVRAVPFCAQKTPSKTTPSAGGTINSITSKDNFESESEEESIPTPISKRQREESGSPKLPKKILKASLDTFIAAPLHDATFPSSQTDSTFPSSEHSSSEGDLSDGDRAETGVIVLMQSMLNRICKAHDESNGYSFSVGNDVETLTIPICGNFPKTKPDLLVRMYRGHKTYSIFDFEGKRLNMQMTKEEKFGQEVAHLLGRANLMKSTKTSDEYKVFLMSAHNMNISFSMSVVQNKYLHRLQTGLPGSRSLPGPVYQYGPFNLFNTKDRLLAVETIYKLMVDQAEDIINGE